MIKHFSLNKHYDLSIINVIDEKEKINLLSLALELQIAIRMGNTSVKRIFCKSYLKIKFVLCRRHLLAFNK